MTAKTRFLTGGLASVAIASAVTLTTPSAFAADQPNGSCGQPEVPAVYVTVIHEPELRRVPAVTHDEWRWERDLTTEEHQFTKMVTPEHTEMVDRSRDVAGTTEYLWEHRVVTQPAVPAVPGTPEEGHYETVVVAPAVTQTEFEYVQQTTGNLQWHDDGWNADKGDEDKGKGWAKTGNTREVNVQDAATTQQWIVTRAATDGTPAVDEVSHLEETWAAAPGGDDWTRVRLSQTVPAVFDTLWAAEAPEGYTATGASRSHRTTEQTEGTSSAAPDGEDWTQVEGSRVTVVDQPETSELVGAASTEQVLVSPAVPATEACTDAPQAPGTAVGNGVAAGPKVRSTSAGSPAPTHSAAAGTTTVLPAAGSPVSPLLLTTGLGALLAGSVLVRVGRRRQAR